MDHTWSALRLARSLSTGSGFVLAAAAGKGEQISQSRPDSGLGSQAKDLKPFKVVPSSLGSGKASGLH
jgi:hypothetical protein